MIELSEPQLKAVFSYSCLIIYTSPIYTVSSTHNNKILILIYTGSPAEGSSIHERSFRQSVRNTFQPIEIVATSDACGVTGTVSRDVIRGNSVVSCHIK